MLLLLPSCLQFCKHQGLFQLINSVHQMTKVLELQLQHQSFQWSLRVDFPYYWLVWSPHSPRNYQESSLKPQFKNIYSLMLNLLYGLTLTSIPGFSCGSDGKESSTVQHAWVPFLGREDPLERETTIHSCILTWKIPWIEEPGRLQTMGSQRARQDWETNTLISIHDYWKNHSFDFMNFCQLNESLFFNMLSRFVIVFLPRSGQLLISCLQSQSTVILESQKIKSVTASTFSPSICHEVMNGARYHDFLFFCVSSFSPTFFTFLFDLHQEAL